MTAPNNRIHKKNGAKHLYARISSSKGFLLSSNCMIEYENDKRDKKDFFDQFKIDRNDYKKTNVRIHKFKYEIKD